MNEAETWQAAQRLAIKRIGVMTNAGLSAEMCEMIREDIRENFDIAAKPRGLDWLRGRCSLEDFNAANSER